MRTILSTILFLASATGLFAQNADQGTTVQPSSGFQTNERRGPRPQLDLTADQKAKIKEIREADKDSLKSAIEQARTAREALQSALLAEPENTADIQAKATTLGNIESALTVQRALQEAKINDGLTPAQRTILDTSRKERQTSAAENPIVGTWKLRSLVFETIATGQRSSPFGDHPVGYLGYSPDGRMFAIGVVEDRPKPRNQVPTDEEKARLQESMFAYAGTYTADGEKVIHHVDISWNQSWTGTDQVRFYKLDSNTLTITTAPAKNPFDGEEGRFILVWEKVQ